MVGRFITLEGIDCCGKSTAAHSLVKALRDKGYDVIHTREPGGTSIAEEIRTLILANRDNERVVPMAELLLFAAARAQHIEAKIKPALEAGKIVVSDRFMDSMYAYQGTGRGYIKEVLILEELVHKRFEPNYTLFFDLRLQESVKRLNSRLEEANHLDMETIDFKTKILYGYNQRFMEQKHRMHRIDAMQSIDNVRQQVESWVTNTFVPANPN